MCIRDSWIEPRGKSAALEQHETAGRFTHKSQLQHGSIAERGDQMAQVKPAAGETRSEDADGVNGKVGEVREPQQCSQGLDGCHARHQRDRTRIVEGGAANVDRRPRVGAGPWRCRGRR